MPYGPARTLVCGAEANVNFLSACADFDAYAEAVTIHDRVSVSRPSNLTSRHRQTHQGP